MSTSETQELQLGVGQTDPHVTLTEIEQIIEKIGANYITDLRMLSQEFHRFYTAELTAKDARITELSQRLEAVEHERDVLETRIRELKDASERYISHLQSLTKEFSGETEPTPGEPGALEVRERGVGP